MAIKDKKFTLKIYDSAGTTLLKTLKDTELKNLPRFVSRLNGGYGQMVLNLNLPFDVDDSAIDYMNIVRAYVSDKDDDGNARTRLIYTGFVSAYTPYIREGQEGVELICLGLISLLSFAYFKDGASFEPSYSSVDPSVIIKDIIDHFNTVYSGSLIGYDGSGTTIETVGTNVSYDFEDRKWFEALSDTFGLVDADWWWTVDKTGQLYLKEKPTSATHVFTLEKDIDEVSVEKSSEEVRNSVRVKYASTSAQNSDSGSITEYGLREEVVTDNQITDVTTANLKSNQEVGNNKDAKRKTTLIINAQYDIESVKVGDTCRIVNLKSGSSVFSDNMQIVKINYFFDSVTLQLEEISGDFGVELSKFIS